MKLCRSNENYRIAGVCGGIGEHLGWSAGRVRLVWAVATLFTAFAGVIIHFVLWFLMPKAQPWRKVG
jgi:phage shock protein C